MYEFGSSLQLNRAALLLYCRLLPTGSAMARPFSPTSVFDLDLAEMEEDDEVDVEEHAESMEGDHTLIEPGGGRGGGHLEEDAQIAGLLNATQMVQMQEASSSFAAHVAALDDPEFLLSDIQLRDLEECQVLCTAVSTRILQLLCSVLLIEGIFQASRRMEKI
jgi:hypothetical protein